MILEYTPRLAVAAAAAALLSLGGASAAHAAVSAPPVKLIKPPKTTSLRVARIVSPANDTLVKSAVVPVRLKVGPKVTGVQVFAGTKDISARFTRQGSAFTARLPRSLFKTGTNTLLVQAKGGGTARVSIVVPGSKSAGMSMATGAHAASVASSSPLADPGYVPTDGGQIPVAIHTDTLTYARLTVNGHRVNDLRAGRPLTDHHWLVSSADGLKVGANQLVVESWDRQGNHSIKRWTVNRSAKQPLTEAGPNERVIAPKAWTTLDGSKTKATIKGAKLGYAWRVVKEPKGAKPILRDATSAKPQFKPDKPGVYQLALRATQAKPGEAVAASADSGSEDVTTLDAVPAIGAQGLYISTAQTSTGLTAGGSYCANDPDDPTVSEWLQFDETTLAPIKCGYYGSGPYGVTPAPGTITIGEWNQNAPAFASADQAGSAVFIGTKLVGLNATPAAYDDPSNNANTQLHGWLQPASSDSADNATWVGSDMVQVKTREPSDTSTTNTMEVDGQAYPKTLPAGAQGGYQMVILDNDGNQDWVQLYPMTGDAGTDDQTMNTMAQDIGNAPKNSTFLLQGFGQLPQVGGSSPLAQAIQRLGGRSDVIDRQLKQDSTGGDYSLIAGGSNGSANTWSPGYKATEVSFERTGTTGSQTSLLERDADGNDYVPFDGDSAAPDPVGANRYSLMPMIYGAPTGWNDFIRKSDGTLGAPTAAESAAYGDLVKLAVNQGWVSSTSACSAAPDAIRGAYCNTDANALTVLMNDVSTAQFDSGVAGGRYVEADWDAVRSSIAQEVGNASTVRSAIAKYQGLFGTSTIDGVVDAGSIGLAVKNAINQTDTTSDDANTGTILAGLTDMASILPEVGPALTFASGAFGMDSAMEPDTSPQPALDRVEVSQDTAATALLNNMQTASDDLSSYGDMIVEDPYKLWQASKFFVNHPFTTQKNSDFTHAAEYATQQWLWGTELATAYTVWQSPQAVGANPYCNNKSAGSVGNPFENLSATGNFSSLAADGSTDNWMLGYDNQASGNWGWAVVNHGDSDHLSDTGLPPSITDALFGQPINTTTDPTATTNAGAVMPYFALDYLPFKQLPIAPTDQWRTAPTPSGCQPN